MGQSDIYTFRSDMIGENEAVEALRSEWNGALPSEQDLDDAVIAALVAVAAELGTSESEPNGRGGFRLRDSRRRFEMLGSNGEGATAAYDGFGSPRRRRPAPPTPPLPPMRATTWNIATTRTALPMGFCGSAS